MKVERSEGAGQGVYDIAFLFPQLTNVKDVTDKCRYVGTYVPIKRFKELLVLLWRLGKFKICRVDQQAEDPEDRCSLSPKVVCWRNSLFLGGQSFFYSTDWMRHTHTTDSHLLFSKSDLNVHFI